MLPRSGFSDAQIAALGDFMLDQYILGEVTRISAECPVPVVSIRGRRSSPGGAGRVAASVAGLGGRVSVLGTIGADAEGAELWELLHRALVPVGNRRVGTMCSTDRGCLSVRLRTE
jgi:bifunctional ADP-heptose synthase (sugar kinase/adenylyltransferase)